MKENYLYYCMYNVFGWVFAGKYNQIHDYIIHAGELIISLDKNVYIRKKEINYLPSQCLQRLAGGCPQSVLTGMVLWGHNEHRSHAPRPIKSNYAFSFIL